MNQFRHIVHVINIAPGNSLLSYFVAVISVFVLFFFFQNQRTQVTNGWVDTKTYLVGLLACSAINVVVIFSMKEYFLNGITLRSTIKKKLKMCEVTDNY